MIAIFRVLGQTHQEFSTRQRDTELTLARLPSWYQPHGQREITIQAMVKHIKRYKIPSF